MSHSQRRRIVPGLGERVSALRKAQSLSFQVSATRGGMSINRWRDVERYSAATTETLNKVAKALGVDVDALLGRKSHPAFNSENESANAGKVAP